jgi:UTP--glucose-1-phosphate uridylyltransferase
MVSPVSTNLYTYVGMGVTPGFGTLVLRVPNGIWLAWKSMRARTAVIPAAGLGTRFYPVTKSVPKELLQLIFDEAIGAGCDHIVLVNSRVKTGLETYVTPQPEVVAKLRDQGRDDIADRLQRIGTDVRVTITYQDNPQGLGHAVGCARDAVGDEPFAVLLPDELRGDAGLLRLLIDSCETTGKSAIELKRVPMSEVSAYGVVTVTPESPTDGPFGINGVVEKPKMEDAPSDLIILGRYVLTPEIFNDINDLKPHANGEYQLTDALLAQGLRGDLFGYLTTTKRWDTGTPAGWLEAVLDAAVKNPQAEARLREWITARQW